MTTTSLIFASVEILLLVVTLIVVCIDYFWPRRRQERSEPEVEK